MANNQPTKSQLKKLAAPKKRKPGPSTVYHWVEKDELAGRWRAYKDYWSGSDGDRVDNLRVGPDLENLYASEKSAKAAASRRNQKAQQVMAKPTPLAKAVADRKAEKEPNDVMFIAHDLQEQIKNVRLELYDFARLNQVDKIEKKLTDLEERWIITHNDHVADKTAIQEVRELLEGSVADFQRAFQELEGRLGTKSVSTPTRESVNSLEGVRRERAMQWLASGKVGQSSKYMVCMVFGLKWEDGSPSYPHDWSDFWRCRQAMIDIDLATHHIEFLRHKDYHWKAILDNWSELVKLHGLPNAPKDDSHSIQGVDSTKFFRRLQDLYVQYAPWPSDGKTIFYVTNAQPEIVYPDDKTDLKFIVKSQAYEGFKCAELVKTGNIFKTEAEAQVVCDHINNLFKPTREKLADVLPS
jgi:hypothetical protein